MMFFVWLSLLACAGDPKYSSDTAPTEDTAQTDTASPCETFKAYTDADGDGYGDASAKTTVCSLSEGLVTDHSDCDDADPEVHPGAPERCNSLDDNCNTVVDENPGPTWYMDGDGDGYGDPDNAAEQCAALAGYVADNTDCDDGDANIHPGVDEHCDLFDPAIDENCDGDPEDGAVDMWSWYPDADEDGRSTASDDVAPILACPDNHPSGTNADHSDCDDTDPTILPGADELCDGIDQDCDGNIDENALDATRWYGDNDGDGFGDPYGYFLPPIVSCDFPGDGYVADNTDCYDYPMDEASAAIHPGATEVCNWLDDDCDGFADDDDPEGVTGTTTWYFDEDGDYYGSTVVAATDACEQGAYAYSGVWNIAPNNTDCDDGNAVINPGLDSDGDGFSACDECDDHDWRVNPDATEVVNGYDDNCNGETDEE